MNEETIEVSFIDFELTKNPNIAEWFPLVEKQCGYDLPDYFPLEGGIEQNEDGTLEYVWNAPHYFLCIPVEYTDLLEPFGEIYYEIIKTVNKSQLNKQHEISYWGIGCEPELQPIAPMS